MKLLNHTYTDKANLYQFIESEQIKDGTSLLIQLFGSTISDEEFLQVRGEIRELLPTSAIIGSSTAGIIKNGDIMDDSILISFSVFEHSTVKAKSYCHLTNEEIVESISKDLLSPGTKLLLFFANTFTTDSEDLLKQISKRHPSLIIAGGNGSDDLRFQKCRVFSGTCFPCDASFAVIDSDTLHVKTASLLNWRSIGKELTVTKVDQTRLYELDGKPVLDVYEHYLGKEILDEILKKGMEFPLIYNNDGVNVARTPIAVHEDGSLTLAGSLSVGMKVKFGYADVKYIEEFNNRELFNQYPYKMEGTYVYSSSARRSMLGAYLNDELAVIEKIAPTSGFISYGEFFHNVKDGSNCLLNITSTLVMLSEKRPDELIVKDLEYVMHKDDRDSSLRALTTLVARTSEELDENLVYLEQFKKAIDDVAIFSVTDENGIIKDVNKNFEDISGYTKEDLIGKSHNIVRHPDMPKETFNEMWQTIQAGKIWKGMIKNKNKTGKPYYVLTEISPIYNKDGSFREYIGVRNDITELEEYKEALKTELSHTKRSLNEHLFYVQQYEDAINSSVAIVKTDTENVITYANQTFCNLMKSDVNELLGKKCSKFRHEQHHKEGLCNEVKEKLKNKEAFSEILKNIAKDGSMFTVQTVFYPILDLNGNVVEFLQVMHDVTEIINLNEEITTTQKEVVLTMGAIGETRSKETGLHVKRVAEYSYLLALLAGLDEQEAILLKQASPMHDIGKVGIPDSILNKPGKLTPEEFEIMKTHSILGYEMLKHSEKPILKASAIVALTHHEKWNGTGYPYGLGGEEIHIYGRITAIADVFDALGHDRVYKKAWEMERILELFREERGRHFEPRLIDIFVENLERFLEIKKMYESEF